MSLDWIASELAALDADALLRSPRTIDSAPGPEVEIDSRRVVLLCSNNYLGLAADTRVRAAAATAAKRWGAGAGASRLVSGTERIHRDLEAALAAHEGTEDAVLFSSGYLANLGALTALTDRGDVVFSDELNHASIVDGCRLSQAAAVVYRHADVEHLDELISSSPGRRRFVVTDSVFSMDGDLAPLAELVKLCRRHDATLIIDEAHATGVLGTSGAGATDELGLQGEVPVIVGTLSKALGSAGGYVATTRDCAALLRNRARTHIFDTAPPPPAVAAAAEALRIARSEPWRRQAVRSHARRMARELKGLSFTTSEPVAAIVVVHVGDASEAVDLSQRLLDAGVFCPAIRPPSVPDGTSRLRVTLMATHTDDHIDEALDAFAVACGTPTRRRAREARSGIDHRVLRAKGLFVTGTDTGVGKTVVTAAIAKVLREEGFGVAIFKPIQTGVIDGGDDAAYAARLSGCRGEVGVALNEPLAPSVAATLEDATIDVGAIVARFEALRASHDIVVVEGAGGLLVPIDDELTMADLARCLDLPLLVVARPALGTLNHAALTVSLAHARGIDVLGVVVSSFPVRATTAEATNPSGLDGIAPLLGVIPALDSLDVERGIVPDAFEPGEWIGPTLGGRFDRTSFLSRLSHVAVRS